MADSAKGSKVKIRDKKKADQIYSRLLHYALYGTMLVILGVVVLTSTRSEPHDPRSRASNPITSPIQLVTENQSFDNHCYVTGDAHSRSWTGELHSKSSFTVDLPFCTDNSITSMGIAATVQQSEPFTFSAISPGGKIVYANEIGSDKVLCIIPENGREIERGKWQIILTNWSKETHDVDMSVNVANANSPEFEACK